MKIKNIVLSFSAIFILSACGDKSQDEKENIKNIKIVDLQDSNSINQIEILENKNAKEIKVKSKNIQNGKNESYYFNYGIKSEYDANSQPANKEASVRIKPRTTIDANLHIRSPYEKIKISMLVKKLSKKFIVKCSACHNDYANGIIGPSLLNKTSDEILKKIDNFRTGKKSNPLMDDLIKMMSSSEIESLANEIYSFNQEIKQMEK